MRIIGEQQPRLISGFLMAGILMLLSACGGGGSSAPASGSAGTVAAAPVPAGQRAQASLGASGGDVVLSSPDGSQFVLSLPAGALASAVTVAVTTHTTVAGQRFNLRFEPAGLMFEAGSLATVTITLPAGASLPAGSAIATVVAYDGAPMPYTRLPDGRVQVQLGGFAEGTGVVAALASRLATLIPGKSAKAAAAPCSGAPALGNPGDGSLSASNVNEADVYGQCMVGAVQQLASSGQYADAVRANSAVAAYLQSVGAGGANAHITQASSITCAAYANVLETGRSGSIDGFDQLAKLVKPILFWEQVSQQLGANCLANGIGPNDYQTVVNDLTAKAVAYYSGKKGAVVSTDGVDYTDAVKDGKANNQAVQQVQSMQPQPGVKNLVQNQIAQRAQPGLLDAILQAPWQRCRDSGNYDKLIELMGIMNNAASIKTAAQYCGTQFDAQAKDSANQVSATLTPSLGGVKATQQITSGSMAVQKDGKLILSGPIRALQCPTGSTGSNGGSESLQIKLNNTVLQTLTSAPYLASTLEIDMAQALQAASIKPEDFSSATLTIERTGSPCNGFWGSNPQPLMTLGLTSGNICNPRAGYNFCITPVVKTDGNSFLDSGRGLYGSSMNDDGEVHISTYRLGDPGDTIYNHRWSARNPNVATNTHRVVFSQITQQGALVGLPLSNWEPTPPAKKDLAVVLPDGDLRVLPQPSMHSSYSADSGSGNAQHLVHIAGDGGVFFQLGDDGSVFGGIVQVGEAGSSGTCIAGLPCATEYVLRWRPPYDRYEILAQRGPANYNSGLEIRAVRPNGTVVVSHNAYEPPWPPAGGVEFVNQTVSPYTRPRFVDDRNAMLSDYFENGWKQDYTPKPPHLTTEELTANKLGTVSKSGFALMCTGNASPGALRHLYDGRSWSMAPGTLVDPALGWDFSLLSEECFAHFGGVANRQGALLGQAQRNGVETLFVLTPKGQPMP